MVKLIDVAIVIIISVPLAISWTQFLVTEGGLFDFIAKAIDRMEDTKLRTLITCSVCLSGQLSLFIYPLIYFASYGLVTHIVCVTCSMLSASIIVNKLLQ